MYNHAQIRLAYILSKYVSSLNRLIDYCMLEYSPVLRYPAFVLSMGLSINRINSARLLCHPVCAHLSLSSLDLISPGLILY